MVIKKNTYAMIAEPNPAQLLVPVHKIIMLIVPLFSYFFQATQTKLEKNEQTLKAHKIQRNINKIYLVAITKGVKIIDP